MDETLRIERSTKTLRTLALERMRESWTFVFNPAKDWSNGRCATS
jgi:hypothetical protein